MALNGIFSKFSLTDNVAVVTGGCGYLGSRMSIALAEAGATTFATDISIDKFNNAFRNYEMENIHFTGKENHII